MNDEQSTQLSQEMMDAHTECDRVRVFIHWLPVLVRCIITTAARAKMAVAKQKELEASMKRLHSTPTFKEDKLGWLKANWQWLILFLLLLKQNGLDDIFTKVFALGGS